MMKRISLYLIILLSILTACSDNDSFTTSRSHLLTFSTDTVKFNYYERIFKLQKVRDQEDSDMLDRIFASRVYDIGSIFNWGGARDFIANVANGSSFDYMSSLESDQGKMETEMQDTVDYFSN